MAEAAVVETPVVKKERAPLAPPRMVWAEQARNVHVVTTEQGTRLEELFSPGYWSSVAIKFTPWDRIEVRAEDGEFYAELLVLSCERNWAKVKLLLEVKLNAADIRPDQGAGVITHRIEWKGPHHKWCVIRNGDNEMLKSQMDKTEANAWLTGHLKSV